MHQQQGKPALKMNNNRTDDTATQPPADTVTPVGQQGPPPHVGQPAPVARQTRSGRVVRNTPPVRAKYHAKRSRPRSLESATRSR